MDKAIASYFSEKISTIPEIYAVKNHLIFSNSHPSMGVPRPTSPKIIEVGGMHISPPKALPSNLEDFMNSAKHGVIYFSLGTVIQGEKLQPGVIQAMINVFGRLEQKILWKWSDDIQQIPDNVMIGKWFPQQDILSKLYTSPTKANSKVKKILHSSRKMPKSPISYYF